MQHKCIEPVTMLLNSILITLPKQFTKQFQNNQEIHGLSDSCLNALLPCYLLQTTIRSVQHKQIDLSVLYWCRPATSNSLLH